MTDISFRFHHRLRVRWAESDMQGVVFNGHYLTYFDIGMTEYLRAVCGGDIARMQEIFHALYVVSSTIDYHGPARFDEEIDVGVALARLGSSSLTLAFEIRRDGERLISGQSVYVHAPGGQSSPVPDGFRHLLQQFEQVAGQ